MSCAPMGGILDHSDAVPLYTSPEILTYSAKTLHPGDAATAFLTVFRVSSPFFGVSVHFSVFESLFHCGLSFSEPQSIHHVQSSAHSTFQS